MNELQIFKNNEFGEIGIVMVNDKPFFPATEVAKLLGYTNPHKAITDHCKEPGLTKREVGVQTGMKADGSPALQTLEMNFISEGNLYRLISRSKLPVAEKFETWVFDEVLPSIRKHGAYAIDELLENPDLAIAALEKLKAEKELRKLAEHEVLKRDQIIGELKPKADYVDSILNSKGVVTITQIAKDYGMSGGSMNKVLSDLKIQYNQHGQWLLYSKHQTKGYTHSETIHFKRRDGRPDTKMNTSWTQKGRLFIYDELKKIGIVPMIERE